jgi:hypothetical protein
MKLYSLALSLIHNLYHISILTFEISAAVFSFLSLQEDLIYRPSWLQNIAMTYLNKFVEPMSNLWPMTLLRERALKNLMEHIHYEDENSNYVGLCPINKVRSR